MAIENALVLAAARYTAAPPPCAVLCPGCIANQRKIALYREIGPPIEVGRPCCF